MPPHHKDPTKPPGVSTPNPPLYKRSIKDWDVTDQPREKLRDHGPRALSVPELIAILIGSGSAKQSAVELARDIYTDAEHNLYELAQFDLHRLQQFVGVGEAKSITIAAAMELGRRYRDTAPVARPQITQSRDAYRELYPAVADLAHEEFWLLYLNRQNKVLRCRRVSEGGMSGALVDLKRVFRAALIENAAAIIACHNHPSGNLQPSQADRTLTDRMVEVGKLLDLPLLDHLIIAGDRYVSFKDEGWM